MRLTIDLTASHLPEDDLDYLNDAQRAVLELLLPETELNREGRARLYVLLELIELLRDAVRAAAKERQS